MLISEVLSAMRTKIAKGWTQKASARDVDGNICDPSSDKAATWCVLGSYAAVAPRDQFRTWFKVADRLHKHTGPGWTDGWNDTEGRTQEEVLIALDKAIADTVKDEASGAQDDMSTESKPTEILKEIEPLEEKPNEDK